MKRFRRTNEEKVARGGGGGGGGGGGRCSVMWDVNNYGTWKLTDR